MLSDNFGRRIDYLRISVTDLCNYRCIYCMPEHGANKREHRDIMSFEEITAVAGAAVDMGVKKIRLSGGEPLTRRGITSLCRDLSSLGCDELTMTTNGSLLEPLAEELADAGVRRVNISLDTLDPDKFRRITRGGELSDVLRGIDAAERAGLVPIKTNTVMIRGFNDDDIVSIAELTRSRALEVRFIELMPIGPAASIAPDAVITSAEALKILGCPEPIGASGVASLYRLPNAAGRVGFISPVSCAFCSGCGRLRLTADGRIKPCLHSKDEISVRGLSGSALDDALRAAAAAKPRDHGGLSGGRISSSIRSMNMIGG